MRTVLLGVFSCIVLLFSFSCSKDGEGADEQKEEKVDFTEIELNEYKAEILLKQLCVIDSLENGSVNYKSYYGEAIDPVKPTEYFVGVESEEQAETIFRTLIQGVAEEEDIIVLGKTLFYEIEGHGSLKFVSGNGVDQIASIEVDFKEIPQLTRLVFIPVALWPENDASSPFTLGSIWRENSTGYRYVCVRERGGGVMGIMLTFDGGWGSPFDVYDSKLVNGLGSYDAFVALCDFIKNKPTRCEKVFKSPGANLKSSIYYGEFYIGDPSVSKRHWYPFTYWKKITYTCGYLNPMKFENRRRDTDEWIVRMDKNPHCFSHSFTFDYNFGRNNFTLIQR